MLWTRASVGANLVTLHKVLSTAWQNTVVSSVLGQVRDRQIAVLGWQTPFRQWYTIYRTHLLFLNQDHGGTTCSCVVPGLKASVQIHPSIKDLRTMQTLLSSLPSRTSGRAQFTLFLSLRILSGSPPRVHRQIEMSLFSLRLLVLTIVMSEWPSTRDSSRLKMFPRYRYVPVHICNPGIWETGAGASPGIQG